MERLSLDFILKKKSAN